ncbi:MAG: hypothetical protein RLY86_877 [Pseudomonadota bacterium]|jgi:pimeloyl-ACP methyl ester carboxylesterase
MADVRDTQRLPLILLPGLLCDAALWAHQGEYLRGIAAGGTGQGAADVRIADLTGAADGADDMGALADAVLAVAPDRFTLAGLSMGGYVAFEILRRAPGRVARLCLLDTTARPDTGEQTERRQAMIRLAEGGAFDRIPPLLLPGLIHPDRVGEDAVAGEVVRMAHRVGAAAFVRQQRAIMGRADSRSDLSRITVPTLVIVGADDTLTPVDRAAEMADAILGASLHVIPRCGHLSPLEQPAAVNALLREFLA